MTEHKKGGLLGGLKGMFVEDTPDPVKAETAAPQPAPARNTPLPSAPRSASSPMSSFSTLPRAPAAPPPVAADEGSLGYLRKELSKSLSPAYQSFMAQYDALGEVIPDEGMRFKAALKASKTTVGDLATALDALVTTLTATHDKFSATYEASKKKAMDAASAQVEATQHLIETRTQQLSAIQAEIQSLQGKLQTDTEALQAEERRIEGTRAGFEAAYAQVAGELNAQKAHVAAQPRN